MKIIRRLRSVLWRVPVEQEVREELSHHLELRTRELVERGMRPDAAQAEAERRFGNVQRIEAQLTTLGQQRNRTLACREWLDELRQDVAFACRQYLRRPGFTVAAVATLALGIGATTAIFSVVHAVVLRALPVNEPDRVLVVFTTDRNGRADTSVGNFDYIRARVTTLEQLAATVQASFNLSDDGVPERVAGARVTWNYFHVFGARPILGRLLTAGDDRPDAQPVAILSYQFWQRRFGGDRTIVGRDLRMNGVPYEVVGVLPATFEGVASAEDVFVPIAFTPAQLAMYDEHYLETYGRRRADVTLEQVNEELSRTAANLARDHPTFNQNRGAGAEPLRDVMVRGYRTRLFVLLAAVGLVLLIGCANVANLLLVRLSARGRELAIRATIGASGGRIVRQVLTESLVLSVVGGICGLVAAHWALPLLVASAPADVPRLESATVNAPVLTAAITLVGLTTLLVGVLPALHTTRQVALRDELGSGRDTLGVAVRPWLRQTLIAAQAALVLMVLAAAALLVRSAINLQAVPIGFDTSNVLNLRLALPASQYRDPELARNAFRTILANVQGVRGVSVAALDTQPPLVGGGSSNGLIPEGRPLDMSSTINSRSHFVSPDYFRVLRIPLIAGRAFTDRDIRSAPLVMIVSETLARDAFGGDDPIGKRVICCEGDADDPKWKTVVGVVADLRSRGPALPAVAEFYLPMMQIPDAAWTWIDRTMTVIVRPEAGEASALTGAIREAVNAVDPALPVYAVRTMDDGLRETLAQARFNTLLMSLLGLTGLVLAAIGIYGVQSWMVMQRMREIGVHMALGASAATVVREVTLQGLRPVAVGLVAGGLGALAAGRLVEGQLFQVSAHDPMALAAVVALMTAVAALAAVIPATRAATIDPLRALHEG